MIYCDLVVYILMDQKIMTIITFWNILNEQVNLSKYNDFSNFVNRQCNSWSSFREEGNFNVLSFYKKFLNLTLFVRVNYRLNFSRIRFSIFLSGSEWAIKVNFGSRWNTIYDQLRITYLDIWKWLIILSGKLLKILVMRILMK